MHGPDLTPIAIILAFAFLSGLIFKKLRQPVLVGYIVMGVLLGPFVAGLDGTQERIAWFAELGILLLMFMLGLELDLAKFKKMFSQALLVVVLQITMGVGIMSILSFWLGFNWPTTILLGFIVSLSSTAVAIGTLRDLRQENTQAGMATTAILIAQDLAVIPMLLIVSVMAQGEITVASLAKTLLAMVVVALTLAGVFALTAKELLVRRIETFLNNTIEQPVIAGVAFCAVAAAVSGSLGLSTAYGAFAAGLFLGNLGTVATRLEAAVAPIYNLLIMIFFLSVGLIIDVSYVWNNLVTVIGLVLTVLVFKTIINTTIVQVVGLSERGTSIVGASLGQIGEFSFVLAGLGLSTAILSGETYQLALVVIAASLIFSPIWVVVVQKRFGIQSIAYYIPSSTTFEERKNQIKQRLGIK